MVEEKEAFSVIKELHVNAVIIRVPLENFYSIVNDSQFLFIYFFCMT